MEREYFGNNAKTTLNGGITSSATTLVLTSATNFPSMQFRLIVDDEIMYCSSRSGTTCTVIRGFEGTTAASHLDLAPIAAIVTAGAMEAIRNDIMAMMGDGRKPITANTYGDEFDVNSMSGAWTTVFGTGTGETYNTTVQDRFCTTQLVRGSNTAQWTAYMKNTGSLTAGNSIEGCFRAWSPGGGFPHVGLFMSDGATYGSGTQMSFCYSVHENLLVLRYLQNYLGQVATNYFGYFQALNTPDIHLKLTYKGSDTYDTFVSVDGIQWWQFQSNVSCGAGITPSWVGFGMTTWSMPFPTNHSCRFFRTNF